MTFRDPVCGILTQPEKKPNSALYYGRNYYFCSKKCEQRFLLAPEFFALNPAWSRFLNSSDYTPADLFFSKIESWKLEDIRLRLDVAYLLVGVVLALSIIGLLPVTIFHSPRVLTFLGWGQLILATPVVLWCASPIYKLAWLNLKNKKFTIYTFFLFSIVINYISSLSLTLFNTLSPQSIEGLRVSIQPTFFLLTLSIVFSLWARQFELRHLLKIYSAFESLICFKKSKISKIFSNQTKEIHVSEVNLGDLLAVHNNEIVLFSGIVVAGKTDIDESGLNGVDSVRKVNPGSKIYAGSRNVGDTIIIKSATAWNNTLAYRLSKILNSRDYDLHTHTKLDGICLLFSILTLVISTFTYIFWLKFVPDSSHLEALLNSFSIILFSYSPTISLIATVANSAILYRSNELGVFVKDSHALTTLATVDTFVFDKTGTLIQKPNSQVQPQLSGVKRKQALIHLNPNVQQAIIKLMARGIRIIMATGDLLTRSRPVADQLAIYEIYTEQTLEGKLEIVNSLKKSGHCVAMVGDGVSDSAAMIAADVSIGFITGDPQSVEASDIVLKNKDILSIFHILKLTDTHDKYVDQILSVALFFQVIIILISSGALYKRFNMTLSETSLLVLTFLSVVSVSLLLIFRFSAYFKRQ